MEVTSDIRKIVSIGIKISSEIIRKKIDFMVIVVCPLMHDKIISIVEGIPSTDYHLRRRRNKFIF